MDQSNINESARNGSNSRPRFNIRENVQFRMHRIRQNIDHWQQQQIERQQREWQQQAINLSQSIYQNRVQLEENPNHRPQSQIVNALQHQRRMLNTHQHYAPVNAFTIATEMNNSTNVTNNLNNSNNSMITGMNQFLQGQQSTSLSNPTSTADLLSQSLIQMQQAMNQTFVQMQNLNNSNSNSNSNSNTNASIIATSPSSTGTTPQSTITRRTQLMRESMAAALHQMTPVTAQPVLFNSNSKRNISFDSELPQPPAASRARTRASYRRQLDAIRNGNQTGSQSTANTTDALINRANVLGISTLNDPNSRINRATAGDSSNANATNTNGNSNQNTNASQTPNGTGTGDNTLNLTNTDIIGNSDDVTKIRFASGKVSFIEKKILQDAMELSMIVEPDQQQEVINNISLNSQTLSESDKAKIKHLSQLDQNRIKRLMRFNNLTIDQAIVKWRREIFANSNKWLGNGNANDNDNDSESSSDSDQRNILNKGKREIIDKEKKSSNDNANNSNNNKSTKSYVNENGQRVIRKVTINENANQIRTINDTMDTNTTIPGITKRSKKRTKRLSSRDNNNGNGTEDLVTTQFETSEFNGELEQPRVFIHRSNKHHYKVQTTMVNGKPVTRRFNPPPGRTKTSSSKRSRKRRSHSNTFDEQDTREQLKQRDEAESKHRSSAQSENSNSDSSKQSSNSNSSKHSNSDPNSNNNNNNNSNNNTSNSKHHSKTSSDAKEANGNGNDVHADFWTDMETELQPLHVPSHSNNNNNNNNRLESESQDDDLDFLD
ncbi:MAG: hypothetical protein ACPG2Y_01130, partial [Acholeplasmataceae bacterium]